VECYCAVREQSSHISPACRQIVFLLQMRQKKRFFRAKNCVSSIQKLPTRSTTNVELGDISRSRAGTRIAVGTRKDAPHRSSYLHQMMVILVEVFNL
jgi:hypothetical protein